MRLNLATLVTEPTSHPDVADDDVVDVLRTLGAGMSAGQAERVDAILSSTASAQVRNAAALALLDAQDPRLGAAINRLLRRPEIAATAGTLLFCLMESKSPLAAAAIPVIVRGGSYEARSELLILTSDRMVSFEDEAEMDTLHAELSTIASSADTEAAEVAGLALEDLEVLRQTTTAKLPSEDSA